MASVPCMHWELGPSTVQGWISHSWDVVPALAVVHGGSSGCHVVPLTCPCLWLPAGEPHVPDLPGGRVGGAAGGGLRLAGAVPHNSLEDEDAGPGRGPLPAARA